MDLVAEVHVIGKIVHARPNQRLVGAIAFANGFEIVGVGPNLRVAVHAGLGRGYACEARFLDGGVTVLTLNAESGDVVLMAEWDRLLRAHTLIGPIRRALQLVGGQSKHDQQQSHEHQADPRKRVRAAMEDLRHVFMIPVFCCDYLSASSSKSDNESRFTCAATAFAMCELRQVNGRL